LGAGIKGKVATASRRAALRRHQRGGRGRRLVAPEILVADLRNRRSHRRIYWTMPCGCAARRQDRGGQRQFSFAANRKRMAELFLDIGISAAASRSQPKGLRYPGIERISRLCKKYWSNLRRRASGCGFQFLVLAMLALFRAAVLLSWGIMLSA
jgi:hypothetical protein